MTCIAALVDTHSKTIYMGGDSAGTRGYYTVMTMKTPKVFINQGFLFGSTGTMRTLQILQHSFVPPSYHPKDMKIEEFMNRVFVDALRTCLKDSGAALKDKEQEGQSNETLVGYRGKIFLIDSAYAAIEVVDNYMAVGCGDELALGSLFSTEKTRLSPRQRLEMALNAASYHCNSVRSPYNFQELSMTLEELQEEPQEPVSSV